MVIASRGNAPLRRQVSMMAGTFCIKPSETETLLGGHVHQTLQWNQHISDHKCSLIRQLTGRINGLKQIARTATFSTRLMIANGAIMSKLVYLITVWGGASQYLLKAVQVKQLDAARTVCGFNSWGWSRRRLLKKVGWMSVRQLVFFHTVLQTFKTITTGLPKPLHASLPTDHPYRTRNAAVGNIRFNETFISTNTFKYRAMTWYNSVPSSVKSGKLASVKRKLRIWIEENVAVDWG